MTVRVGGDAGQVGVGSGAPMNITKLSGLRRSPRFVSSKFAAPKTGFQLVHRQAAATTGPG